MYMVVQNYQPHHHPQHKQLGLLPLELRYQLPAREILVKKNAWLGGKRQTYGLSSIRRHTLAMVLSVSVVFSIGISVLCKHKIIIAFYKQWLTFISHLIW
jgi:hypothetical protein